MVHETFSKSRTIAAELSESLKDSKIIDHNLLELKFI